MRIFDRTCVQVNLDAIAHNYGVIRREFADQQIMTVLKGNAYGHGITGILPACEAHTDAYAVATAEEGMEIRRWGSRKPILVFGPVPSVLIAEAAAFELTFTVGSLFYAELLQAQLQAAGLTATCHLKIDTGLNRTGLHWREESKDALLTDIEKIHALSCLQITGTYTHCACPESTDPEDIRFTQLQFDRFQQACNAIQAKGLPTGLRHCCATGGALAHPEFRMDMVRLGMMVYGQCDTLAHQQQLGLQEAMCWKSRIIQIDTVASGESISYGRTFKTQKETVVGVVACGYADGYRRSYQGFGTALCDGKHCDTLGRICMDYLLIDLTQVQNPQMGMEVVLLGSQGGQHISAIEISEAVGSVCGEVTGAISARVPRYYISGQGE